MAEQIDWDAGERTPPGATAGSSAAGIQLPASAEPDWNAGERTPPVVPRSLAKEVPIQAYAGATIDMPRQVGQAMQFMSEPGHPVYDKGKELQDWADTREKENPDLAPQTEGRGFLGRALSSGARALAPSAVPMALGAVGSMAGPGGTVAGVAAGTFGMFGASQAQQTYDRLLQSGVAEPEAQKAAWINLMIEGGGETAADIAGLKLFGMFGKAIAKGATPVAGAIKNATETGVIKPFLRQLPKTAAIESSTEFAQNFGEAWVENRYGAQNPEQNKPFEQGVQGAEAALGMTLLLAPFGLGGFAHRARQNQKVADALTDPNAPEAQRIAATKIVYDEIYKVNPEAARAWSENATVAIAGKAPILLDESSTQAAEPAAPPLALGHQAGESLVVFPDGSAMTRAQYEQEKADGMIHAAPVTPGPLTSAANMAINAGVTPVSTAAGELERAGALFPFPSQDAAQKRADFLAQREANPQLSRVVPHPAREGRFAVLPDEFTNAGDVDAKIAALMKEGQTLISHIPPSRKGNVSKSVMDHLSDLDSQIQKLTAEKETQKAYADAEAKKTADMGKIAAESKGPAQDFNVERATRVATVAGSGIQEGAPKTAMQLALETARAKKGAKTPATTSPAAGAVSAKASAAAPQAASTVDAGAHEAATSPTNKLPEPTFPQKEAGNYKKGSIKVGGLDISVENPEGSVRRSHPGATPKWERQMQGGHYGYVKGVPARAKDKEHVDVFVKPGTVEDHAGPVFVVDQNHENGQFDEPKAMIGYADAAAARAAYLKNYQKGWESRVRGITPMSMEEFKARLQDPKAFLKPQQPTADLDRRATLPAVRQQLYVEHDGRRYPVDSLEDASRKWEAVRDRTGKGVSEIGNGVIVTDQDGKEIARISYNGRVWPPGEYKPGNKPLYEPYREGAVSHPENRFETPPTIESTANPASAALESNAIKKRQIQNFEQSGFEAAQRGEPRNPPPGPAEIADAWLHGWDRSGVAHEKGGVTIDQTQALAKVSKEWNIVDANGEVIEGGFATKGDAQEFANAEVGVAHTIEPAQTAAQAAPAPVVPAAAGHSLRPLVESLIKRRAAARQIGNERAINTAIERAKTAMAGGDVKPSYFSNLSKLIKAKDAETAGILDQIAAEIKNPTKAKNTTPVAEKATVEKGMSDAEIARRNRLKQQAAAKKRIDTVRDSIIPAIAKLGGINIEHRQDITGEEKGNRSIPFVGHLFTQNGRGLDDMATSLGQYGYLTPQELEDTDGGVQALRDKIRAEYDGVEDQYSTFGEQVRLERDQELEAEGVPATPENTQTEDILEIAAELDAAGLERIITEYAGKTDAEFRDAVKEFINEHQRQNAEDNQGGEAARGGAEAASKTGSDTEEVAPGGFDSEAFDKKRNDTIKASRAAGIIHLDRVPAGVESMRGREIFYVHDQKQRGVIRTVDNRGNVYVYWSDKYSADKELASEAVEDNKAWLKSSKALPYMRVVRDGNTYVMQSSLGPSDLKDYAFSDSVKPEAEPLALTGETPAQISTREAKEKAEAEAKAREEAKPTGPSVKADQTDLFNTQGGFDFRNATGADRLREAEQKNEDVGENLWYNRRNFTGKALDWNDIKNLNDTLKVKEVIKTKVWPRPNYEQLVADGLQPFFAYFIKKVYDGISVTPAGKTDEDLQRYISTVGKIRDAIYDWSKDNNSTREFLNVIAKRAGAMTGNSVSLSAMAGSENNVKDVILDRVWPQEKGKPSYGRFHRGTEANSDVRAIGGNRALKALQFTMDDAVDAMKAIDKGWPKPQESWQKQGIHILAPNTYNMAGTPITRYVEGKAVETGAYYWTFERKGQRGRWSMQTKDATPPDVDPTKNYLLVAEKGRMTPLAFDTEDQAIEAARAAVKREGKGGDIRGMNISEAERSGPTRRPTDENITSQNLMDKFGFRGVNFGREGWINQAERQAYLNHAYDGLLDLADILNVPPKALSLNGMLGIAFGAQGRGGNAAAHFVPGVNEINLTKTMGAGTLAHEFGHALDHYFATQAGLAKQNDPFLSHFANQADAEGYTKRAGQKVKAFGDEIRPEMVSKFRDIVEAMNRKPMSEAEYALRAEASKAKSISNLNSWIKHFRTDIERTAVNKEAALAEFDQLADRMRRGDLGDGYVRVGKLDMPQVIGQIRLLVQDHTKHSSVDFADNWKGLAATASHVKYLMSKKEADEAHAPQSMPTTYSKESIAKDKDKGGKQYWSKPTEMFARAFESFVADELAKHDQTNTFLSDAAQRAQMKNREGTGFAHPYPREEERKVINEAFAKLVGEIKTRETDTGTAMFDPASDARYIVTYELPNKSAANRVENSAPAGAVPGVPSDLFIENSVPATERDQAEERFATETRQIKGAGRFRSGIKKVETAADAAHVFAPIRKKAVENGLILVLNARKRPIAMLRVGIGARTQTSIFPAEISRMVHAIPGAKSIWFSHNHPSGIPQPSRADEMLTKVMADNLIGTGIELAGHILMGGTKAFYWLGGEPVGPTPVTAAVRKFNIPETEFEIFKSHKLSNTAFNSPRAAREFIIANQLKTDTIILLSAQNYPLAMIPVTSSELMKLRTGKVGTGASRLLQAINKSNASAMVLYQEKHHENSAQNLSRFGSAMDTKLLDSFYNDGGALVSMEERGTLGSSGAFFSRGGELPTFYSALARGIEGLSTGAAPANGWKDAIKGLVAKGIAKQAEVEAVGVNDWLDMQQGKVTKQQVADFLAQNGVKVEETVLGSDGQRQAYIDELNRLPRAELLDRAEDAGVDTDTINGNRTDIVDAIVRAQEADMSFELDRPHGTAKFEKWQLPGGENYRELLLSLPTNMADSKWSIRDLPDGRAIVTTPKGLERTWPNRDAAQAWINSTGASERAADAAGTFRSSHFDQPNILAHIRFNERTDAAGKRVLFIEEIQSDWAQKGKKEGFGSRFEVRQQDTGNWGVFRRDGTLKDGGYSRKEDAEAAAHDYRTTIGEGVPSAPFVTKTEAWVALSLKRMIRYAAENGFDKVAWTNGEQQAARYDLSKHIGSIGYSKRGDLFNVVVYGKQNEQVYQNQSASAKDLEDVIGKEVVQKMVNGEGTQENYADKLIYRLEGLDLKVGGEGMKAFYDKIVPNVANDVLKKLGGGRVEGISVPIGDSGLTIEQGPTGRFEVRHGAVIAGTFSTRSEADVFARVKASMQPGFTITPEMRKLAMEGMPLFSRSASSTQSIAERDLQTVVDTAKRSFKNLPEIVQLESAGQAPASLKKAMGNAEASANIEAAFHDGKIYMFRDRLSDMARAEHVLIKHELRHYGLRGTIGPQLDPVLRQLYLSNRALRERADAIRKKYRLESIAEATEEALVETPASEMVRLTGWNKFMLAMRDFLRRVGFDKLADAIEGRLNDQQDRLSSMETTRILNAAEAWVRNGKKPPKSWMSGTRYQDAAMSRGDRTNTESFRKWFGDSKIVDNQGQPIVAFKAMQGNIPHMMSDTGMTHIAMVREEAERWAEPGRPVREVYVKSGKPFDFRNQDDRSWLVKEMSKPENVSAFNKQTHEIMGEGYTHEADARYIEGGIEVGAYQTYEVPVVFNLIKQRGYDGIYMTEEGQSPRHPNLAVFSPSQIKLASGNRGTFDARKSDIRFSRGTAEHLGILTPAQQSALRNVHGDPVTWRDRLNEFKTDWKRNLTQGLFDQYAPILDYSKEAYIMARKAKAGDSTLEALLVYGKVYVDKDGAYRVDYTKAGGLNGFSRVMSNLHGEQDRFFEWVAAQRAERLKGIGLENLYSDADIAALKTLDQGTMKDGLSRATAYAKALQQLNEWNDSILKIASDSGLIDDETRQMYRDQPYVPFYRLQDEGVVTGFGMKAGLVNQSAWKKLKGGTQHLNDDLLANLLQNWSHLITASAKNRAAKATLDAAARAGVADEVPASTPGKGLVGYKEGGKERVFRVADKNLLDAISAMDYAGLGSIGKPFITMKRWLTIGVTVNPAFKIRNLIRDSIQAIGTSQLSYNPAKNIAQGFKATELESETRAQLLAGGGMIRFGSMLDGNNADRTRRLIEQGVDQEMILDDSNKLVRFWKERILPAFEAYQEFGDRGEQITRAALYEQLLAKGMSHQEASFWARDLLDFSMSGKWGAVRIITQIVPFMNARLQGIYKLGRSAKSDYKRMGITLGAVALGSIALLLAYGDDEDWKRREDWDRDNYWWFKVGGLAFRVPKPFEIGAVGTLAERGVEYMISDEMTGERFRNRISATVFNQLSMNPTPQLVKPMMDIYANKDAFTGRPIETMGMERLRKQDRFTSRTSELAKFLGQLGLPDPTQLATGQWNTLSPVQIDALVRGYFSWLGTSTTTALDWGIRPMLDRGERPDMKLRDVFLAGNFVETLPSGSSRYVTNLYNQAAEIEQAYGSYRDALKRGDTEQAKSILVDEADKIRNYRLVERIKRNESIINAQIKHIEASRDISGSEKRIRIDRLQERKSNLAQSLQPR